MAEIIRGEVVVALSNTEVAALTELLDKQDDLDPRLNDFNNTIQAV